MTAYQIIDTPDTVATKLSVLKSAGITAIIRYDDPSGNPHSWKQVSDAEYKAILDAGLAVGIVSEWGNNHDGYFNTAAGTRDGQYSLNRARQRGQPKGTGIYFAVDYDVEPDSLQSRVVPYFRAINTVIGTEYRIGVYGSGYCCESLKSQGLVTLTWVTCSSGFNGSKAYVNAGRETLWQVFGLCDQTYQGLSVDWDKATVADWGQVMPSGQPLPVPTPTPEPVPPPPVNDNLLNPDRIVGWMKAHGCVVETSPKRVNIVYLEGVDYNGVRNDNRIDLWNDRRTIIQYDANGKPQLIFNCPATTEPGTYYDRTHVIGGPLGAALIAPGQQSCWQVGIHHPGYAPHESLVQTGGPVTVYRDYDKSFRRQAGHMTTGYYGINQHSTGGPDASVATIGRWSAGCLVAMRQSEHERFMALVKTDERFLADHQFVFPTTVIPVEWQT